MVVKARGLTGGHPYTWDLPSCLCETLKCELRTWDGRCRIRGLTVLRFSLAIYKGCSVIFMAALRGSWYTHIIEVQTEVIHAQFGIRRQTQAM